MTKEAETIVERETGGFALVFDDDCPLSVQKQGEILMESLRIYANRNVHYKDNWRRYGWRGCLYDLRRKVERAWDMLWDGNPGLEETATAQAGPWVMRSPHDTDDLVDVINYAAITVQAVREGNRDGEGGWW